MPTAEDHEERAGGKLLVGLFWVGVGLAPLAALLLLLGRGDGPLRVAAVLAVLAVVLIGLSITLRRDTDTVRNELEDTLLDEIDMLREDVRGDIATAARAQHRQFSEKLQTLYESVEALRGQLDAARAGYDRPAAPHIPPAHAGPPRPHAGPQRGPAAPPVVPGGVVRHTETVQVTTRSTIVDPSESGRGTVYGGGTVYGSAGAHAAGNGPSWSEPREESWTEQRLRERLGPRAGDSRAAEPRGTESRAADLRGTPDQHSGMRAMEPRGGAAGPVYGYDRDDDPADDERWAGLRAGDRWASVRTDDRGREVRMGERRAAMHSDESGTELRIEDRWASVRRDEPRRWGDDRWSEDRWGPEVEDTGRWDDAHHGGPAALPAASSEPTWNAWGNAHSQENGYGWEEEPPRTRQRRIDYDLADDRWR